MLLLKELGCTNTSLACSKLSEKKCNDHRGHGEEMFAFQISAHFVPSLLHIRKAAASILTRCDSPATKQRVCKLALAISSSLSTILPPSELAVAACEAAAACILDEHCCRHEIRELVFSIVHECGLTAAEKEFIFGRLELVTWI